jgi:putative membrane protein
MRTAAIILGIVLVVLVLLVGGVLLGRLIAGGGSGFMPRMDRDFGFPHHDFWGFGRIGGLETLVILIVLGLLCLLSLGVLGAVWWLVSRGTGATRGVSPESSLEILRRRYAQGEITREEFQERRETLTRGNE